MDGVRPPDDLACVVDAKRKGLKVVGGGVGEGGVGAAAVQEAIRNIGVRLRITDDLAIVVDAPCIGAAKTASGGIVDRCVDIA